MDQCFKLTLFECYHRAEQGGGLDETLAGGRCQQSPRKLAQLEVQLQSKLNLPRIIRRITRRSNFTKAGARVVARS